jgi:hypothetical protein
MSASISELVNRLRADPWREEEGFSQDIIDVHDRILRRDLTDDEIADILNSWLASNQPCLFGRIGARIGLISYCILSDSDLQQSDSFIQEKIQSARLRWLQDSLAGEKSAFVILAVSPQIAAAQPDSEVMQLARKLCSFYLLRDIQPDQIYLDTIELAVMGDTRIRWDVGVNYFSAQGDRRWWHDHRIPGGLAFSMNSVGHMVKSGKLAKAMKDFEKSMSLTSEDWSHPSIDSLEKALVYAMRTIANASEAVSGKATCLLPAVDASLFKEPPPPIELPSDLRDKNHREYAGYYHTDITLPSEYFLSDVTRPAHIESRFLDFTYLFDRGIDNLDLINVGEGRRVSATEGGADRSDLMRLDRRNKRNKARGKEVTGDQ